jgi:DHA1 family inner membrane transport protein
MPPALLALAIGAFGIGTTEFVIMGLLPEVAGTFDVSIPTAGLLISGYAIGVAVGAPILTAAGSRFSRKKLLLSLLVLFIVGNVLSAVAPTYGVMLAGRLVASLCHGAFFGVGAVVAGTLVAPNKQASAIAMMFTGLTVATVLGVPLGTALGHALGWRSAFWAVAALGVIAFVAVLTLVPDIAADKDSNLRRELSVFRRPQVWLALATTSLGWAGIFASFTYITPMMTGVAGFSANAVTWLLVLFGVGLVAGNIVGGKAADRWLRPSLYVSLGALAVVLLVFTATAHAQIPAAITIVVFGAAAFATTPPLQTGVMNAAEGAPALASAANIGAFNLGNAAGAWLGGLAIDAGLGYTAPNWIGSILAAAGLGVALLSGVLGRRPMSSPVAAGLPR